MSMPSKDPTQAITLGSEMIMRLRSAMPLILFAVVLVASSVLFYYMFREFLTCSDNANLLLMAEDIASGNWRLKGWWLPIDGYWTLDAIPASVAIFIAGPSSLWLHVLPAIYWAALFTLTLFVSYSRGLLSTVGIAVILGMIAMPVLRNNYFMELISYSPIHIISLICAILTFVLLDRRTYRFLSNPGVYIILALLSFAMAAGDPLTLVIGILPAALTCLLFTREDVKTFSLKLLAVCVGAALGTVSVHVNAFYGGAITVPMPIRYANFDDLPLNFKFTVLNTLVMTGTNFFGRTITGAIPFIVRIPMLLALVFGITTSCGKLRRYVLNGSEKDLSPLYVALTVAVLLTMSAPLLTSMMRDLPSVRYIIPALVFSTLIAARYVPQNQIVRASVLISSLISLSISVSSYAAAPTKYVIYPYYLPDLVSELERRHLTFGYGPYWYSSIVTESTDHQITIRALINENSKVVPFKLLSKSDWYRDLGDNRPFFVISRQPEMPLQSVVATFGKPSAIYQTKYCQLLVYEK